MLSHIQFIIFKIFIFYIYLIFISNAHVCHSFSLRLNLSSSYSSLLSITLSMLSWSSDSFFTFKFSFPFKVSCRMIKSTVYSTISFTSCFLLHIYISRLLTTLLKVPPLANLAPKCFSILDSYDDKSGVFIRQVRCDSYLRLSTWIF